jgi:hypothetical protein
VLTAGPFFVQLPNELVKPAVVDPRAKKSPMGLYYELGFRRTNLSQSAAKSLIQDGLKWFSRLPRQIGQPLRQIIVERERRPHSIIMMLSGVDVKAASDFDITSPPRF